MAIIEESGAELSRFRRPLAACVVGVSMTIAVAVERSSVEADGFTAGASGTDVALPATDSAVVVRGRGPFASMEISVNQTRDLSNQAISVTWRGAPPSLARPTFAENYLQFMQCWGEPDGDPQFADNPGPPPTQCVFGATYGRIEGPPSVYKGANATTRLLGSTRGQYDASGYIDEATKAVWRPFVGVDGVNINVQFDVLYNPAKPTEQGFWLNPDFDQATTNEIAGSLTAPNGTGSELVIVNTGVQSSGVGCGKRVEKLADGTTRVPACWLVIVPRGTRAQENPEGTFDDAVNTSPLSDAAWKNRIAIPLEFNPVDSPCPLGASARRLSGSELPYRAIATWQPVLCGLDGLPPYSYAPVSDATARQQLANPSAGAPGMVIVSRPVDEQFVRADNPIVYAPVTLSGLGVGFTLDRITRAELHGGGPIPADELDLAGSRVATLNLTPRLVAKLLTQSYRQAVMFGGGSPGYAWLEHNPQAPNVDPDFLQFNPEFAALSPDWQHLSTPTLPLGNSDAARALWAWILADPEAAAWLGGAPDEWGMTVNPAYSTDPAVNSTGSGFGSPLPNNFPKSEPFCFQAPTAKINGATIVPPPLCGTDWVPYVNSYADAARAAQKAYDGAKLDEDRVYATSSATYWKRQAPQAPSNRTWLAITDTASASQYGVQMASLSRAGDDGSDRRFIAPTSDTLRAGAAAMRPGSDSDVLEPDPAVDAENAYPLTMLAYAAIAPLGLDQQARDEYAAFLDYAAGPGQTPGRKLGQLPSGYAPLPPELLERTVAAAALVRDPATLVPVTTTTTTTVPASSTTIATTGNEEPPLVASSSNRNNVAASAGSNGSSSNGSGASTSAQANSSSQTPSATLASDVLDSVPVSSVPDSTIPDSSPPSSPPTDSTVPDPPLAGDATGDPDLPPVTPSTRTGLGRYVVVVLFALMLLSGLGALEITKRPRRAAPTEGLVVHA